MTTRPSKTDRMGALTSQATSRRSGWHPACGLGIAALVIALDQLSKWVMLNVVMTPPRIIEVTPFFNLVYVWNRGISFGMFNTDSPWNRWTLPVVALLIVVLLVWWLRRAQHWLLITGLGLVIGGALGNVIDRALLGAVFDFLDVHAYGYHWPAFNIADSAITVGVCLLISDPLFGVSARSGGRRPGP